VAPKLTVFEASETNIGDPNVNTVGMDYIWQNMDTTNSNSFTTIRKFTNCDVDVVVLWVAGHVQKGWYRLVSLRVSKHSLVVIYSCDKAFENFPTDALDGWKERDVLSWDGARCCANRRLEFKKQ
jgi:hypothetical protein